MQAAAAWTIEQWERAASRASETLAACSLEPAVDGFIRVLIASFVVFVHHEILQLMLAARSPVRRAASGS